MNHIRYVEYDAAHTDDFVFDQPYGHDCWLLLLIHTPALFWTDGKITEYPAHSAVLFAPNTKIYYRACCRGGYVNDWLRFDSDEIVVSTFPKQNVPFPVSDSEYCHNLFQLLTWEHAFPQAESDRIISRLLHVLLSKLRESAAQTMVQEGAVPRIHDLLLLRKEIYNRPHSPWSITSMASQFHLSEGYLQTIYKKAFGVSCMEDVIASRIRLACDQLQFTSKPVAQVAEECGYNNVEHFCRQFRRQMGTSPGKFRAAAAKLTLSESSFDRKEKQAACSYSSILSVKGQ